MQESVQTDFKQLQTQSMVNMFNEIKLMRKAQQLKTMIVTLIGFHIFREITDGQVQRILSMRSRKLVSLNVVKWTNSETIIQTDRQTDRQSDKHSGGQTSKHNIASVAYSHLFLMMAGFGAD